MKLVGWAEHRLTSRYVNANVSGDQETYWLDWAMRAFRVTGGRGLSLGSGSGYLERRIIDGGYALAMEGVDVSEEAVELARAAGGDRPLTYTMLDLNRDELYADRYDFVVSAAALHHVTNLEHCLAQVHRSLKEGGLLIMHEYIGPDRFQWPDDQLALVRRVYSSLPARYRYNHLTGSDMPAVERKPLWHMIDADPSEAVRSSEILEVVSWFFDELGRRNVGGVLLHPLLEGIIGNFREENECDESLLRLIISLEKQLTRHGYFPSDFAVLVCRKRDPRISPNEAMRLGDEKMDIITRQENEILDLNRRLEEAELQNRELAEAYRNQQRELEELHRERELLIDENSALKSRGLMKILRLSRARLRLRSMTRRA
jgi:SAM-dependent methyltransferase